MSYEQTRGGFTSIDELPDLEDIDNRPAPTVPMIRERPGPNNMEPYQKYLRSSAPAMVQSGMSGGPPVTMLNNNHFSHEGYGPPNPGMQHATLQPQEMYQPPEPKVLPVITAPDPLNISCIDIARHIQDCPICSKLYNNDRTVYVVAIVVLAIVCLLLLKRVLNV